MRAQEALTNAVKRSGATTIGVVLVQTEKRVQLVVEDNGRGFEPIPPVTHGHLGR